MTNINLIHRDFIRAAWCVAATGAMATGSGCSARPCHVEVDLSDDAQHARFSTTLEPNRLGVGQLDFRLSDETRSLVHSGLTRYTVQ